MDYDFYECADLIDELEMLKRKRQEDLIRAERIQGVLYRSFLSCEFDCLCVCVCV